jgi:hypothetical protein
MAGPTSGGSTTRPSLLVSRKALLPATLPSRCSAVLATSRSISTWTKRAAASNGTRACGPRKSRLANALRVLEPRSKHSREPSCEGTGVLSASARVTLDPILNSVKLQGVVGAGSARGPANRHQTDTRPDRQLRRPGGTTVGERRAARPPSEESVKRRWLGVAEQEGDLADPEPRLRQKGLRELAAGRVEDVCK